MSKCCNHGPEFKARVAMDAISGRKMIQMSQLKRLLLDSASELFTYADT